MTEKSFDTISNCRSCGCDSLVDILDLGEHPLANALISDESRVAPVFRLSTAFCRNCSLFQLKETVRKEILFNNYVWVTGTSSAARGYAGLFAQRVIDKAALRPGELVFEIGSNDGTVLKNFTEKGINVLGIEPARNIVEIARKNGVRTECSFWEVASAEKFVKAYGTPRVVMARNVVPHVSDLSGVIDAIARVLPEDGIGVIEFHSGRVIAEELHYDSIYHEHLCYFTLHSLAALLRRYGFYPFSLDTSPISGGSIVLYFSKQKRPVEPVYSDVLNIEKETGIDKREAWEEFARRSIEHRSKTLSMLEKLKGKNIVGFGASARSSTFMGFCGIGRNYLKAVIDNNPLKQGLWTPVGNVPIVSFKRGMELKPDIIFILAWNFSGEIMEECKRNGFTGKYFTALPESPRLIS